VQNGALIGYAVTDGAGDAIVAIDLVSDAPVTCTVTGVNLYPWQGVATVTEVQEALTCIGAEIVGSDELVPGRVTDLLLQVRNTGSMGVSFATATVAVPPEVALIDGRRSSLVRFWREKPRRPRVRCRSWSRATRERRQAALHADTLAGTEQLATTEFRMTVAAPECVAQSMTDGGDGVFDAGEEFDLILTLRNQGAVSGGALAATLEAPAPMRGDPDRRDRGLRRDRPRRDGRERRRSVPPAAGR